MADHIVVKGGYYDVGKQLGEAMKQEINLIIESYKSSSFYRTVQQYLTTDTGRDDLQRFMVTTEMHLPTVVTELKGLADGSGADYNDLFLLNASNEFVAILKEVPGSSHGVEYTTIIDGCTNISMEIEDKQVYLVHTEDINPDWVQYGVMLTATILDKDTNEVLEEWTQYIVPGVLPGGTFGFNKYGLINAHNNIYQKGVYKHGIPRPFICRSLLGLKTAAECKERLLTKPGTASGFSLLFIRTHECKNGEIKVEYNVIEIAGTETGILMGEFQPEGFYYHCNIFQHLSHECHPEESSIHRAATISQYKNRRQAETLEDLRTIISDVSDSMFPVYRSGVSPDHLATAATGIYDCKGRQFYVYTDKPSKHEPILTFPIPSI